MKKITSAALLLLLNLCLFNLFAESAKYQDENYSISVNYNNKVIPGDALFVRLELSYPKNHKKLKSDDKIATLQLFRNDKLIEKAPFYSVTKRKNTTYAELLCGVPVSPWYEDGDFKLKVIFSIGNDEAKEFFLPVEFVEKEFPHEIIELNESNTNIRTDMGPERMAQIKKLNDILFTSMPQDVYSLKKFAAPTTSTRYTSHFGDRRTFVYTNGEKSSTLHYGNDYGIPEGSEVRACQEGRVVMAEWRISTGYSVVIEHLPGLYSLYYHLSSMNVKEGDNVRQGQLIAKSGSTGLATGPHLHWEIRLNGGAVRPEFFISDYTFNDIP